MKALPPCVQCGLPPTPVHFHSSNGRLYQYKCLQCEGVETRRYVRDHDAKRAWDLVVRKVLVVAELVEGRA